MQHCKYLIIFPGVMKDTPLDLGQIVTKTIELAYHSAQAGDLMKYFHGTSDKMEDAYLTGAINDLKEAKTLMESGEILKGYLQIQHALDSLFIYNYAFAENFPIENPLLRKTTMVTERAQELKISELKTLPQYLYTEDQNKLLEMAEQVTTRIAPANYVKNPA